MNIHVKPYKTPQEALRCFNDNEVPAAAIYSPFLEQARGDSHIIARSADPGERPRIVDVLAVHERCLSPENRGKVEALIRAWCEGVTRLEAGDARAIESARTFLGRKEDAPITRDRYDAAVAGMQYSGKEDNAKFFQRADGRPSDFDRRLAEAYKLLKQHEFMKTQINLNDCDGSEMFYRSTR
jgi:hypothetical protein